MTEALLMSKTIGNVTEVVVVLGKRLVDSQLTAEGRSRIEALAHLLPQLNSGSFAVIFCGGRLANQQISEAQAMFDYLTTQFPLSAKCIRQGRVLLEDQSTTSVENIANASAELIKSRLCSVDDPVKVMLLSNDYHIERILEIEQLMPEQGLLNRLKINAQQVGLKLVVPLQRRQHILARYPHQTVLGDAFLLVDQLTTYRVYMEGVVGGVFQGSLTQVRAQPYAVAMGAIKQLFELAVMQQYVSTLGRLREIIEQTPVGINIEQLTPLLAEFNQLLLKLNRRIDPEC